MSGEDAAVRAFVALEIDPGLRRILADLIEGLRSELRGVRWVAPEKLHITLRFLGEASPESLVGVRGALEPLARKCLPVQCPTRGLGIFPPRGAPRVLWVGFELPDPVRELQQAVEAVARASGFRPERRPFRPHLTLGRFRGRVGRPGLPEVALPSARLVALTLFRSELCPDGARYTPLLRIAST